MNLKDPRKNLLSDRVKLQPWQENRIMQMMFGIIEYQNCGEGVKGEVYILRALMVKGKHPQTAVSFNINHTSHCFKLFNGERLGVDEVILSKKSSDLNTLNSTMPFCLLHI